MAFWGGQERIRAREPTFAYISPDAPEFRKLMVDCIGRLVNDYAVDAFHLDQSAFPIYDFQVRCAGQAFDQGRRPPAHIANEGVRFLPATHCEGIGAVARLG